MSFDNFMNKVRYWDNLTARWILRHFYLIFFQIVLVIIFFIWFVNLFNVLDITFAVDKKNNMDHALTILCINTAILVLLMLFNSFWLLFTFSSIVRMKTILRDISYNINKLNPRGK